MQEGPKVQEEDFAKLKQNCRPSGAAREWIDLAPWERGAGALPAVVVVLLQSAGRCPRSPHRKHRPWGRFFDGEVSKSEEACLFVALCMGAGADGDGAGMDGGRKAIMVSAVVSRMLMSWLGLWATASRCWMSYSITKSQV